MVSGKCEIWGGFLSHLEGCLICDKDAADFCKVLIANDKHDIGRYIVRHNRSIEQKILLRALPPGPFLPRVIAVREITLLDTGVNKWSLLRFKRVCFYDKSEFSIRR